ncbi:MAG: H(+)/Cl(-) exchange transporter ClcA [Acidobacteria bacterium]|nr:H(+)/Cl(-) exchange transporter ClcA [Acidobacteriota bacterium]
MPKSSIQPLSKGARAVVAAFRGRHQRRRRLFPSAVLVGLAAGGLSVLYRLAVEALEEVRTGRLEAAAGDGIGKILLAISVSAALAAFSVWLTRRFAPTAAGSGIPHLKAVLHRLRPLDPSRLVPVKFTAGLAALGAGFALGREGPTVQMGGAIGRWISFFFPVSARERYLLIAAGAGAGLSAAFNAPLAGVVFVLEEVQHSFSPGALSTAFVACLTSDVVARFALGQLPVFHTTALSDPPLAALPLFVCVGLAAGLLGVGFNRGLLGALAVFDRIPGRRRVLAAASVGAVVGAVGLWRPALLGGGTHLVETALEGTGTVGGALSMLLGRLGLTLASYATGAPGGIFAPLLVLGSELGLAAGKAFQAWAPAFSAEPEAVVVVAMGALFAATVRAPLTGIVLMLEMTQSYALMLPLLVATYVAQTVADWMGDRPIYETLLERELERGEAPEEEDSLLVELDLHAGAPWEGRRVVDLDLPAGCWIVSLERALDLKVVSGNTTLRAGDHLTLLLAPARDEVLAQVRKGTGTAH